MSSLSYQEAMLAIHGGLRPIVRPRPRPSPQWAGRMRGFGFSLGPGVDKLFAGGAVAIPGYPSGGWGGGSSGSMGQGGQTGKLSADVVSKKSQLLTIFNGLENSVSNLKRAIESARSSAPPGPDAESILVPFEAQVRSLSDLTAARATVEAIQPPAPVAQNTPISTAQWYQMDEIQNAIQSQMRVAPELERQIRVAVSTFAQVSGRAAAVASSIDAQRSADLKYAADQQRQAAFDAAQARADAAAAEAARRDAAAQARADAAAQIQLQLDAAKAQREEARLASEATWKREQGAQETQWRREEAARAAAAQAHAEELQARRDEAAAAREAAASERADRLAAQQKAEDRQAALDAQRMQIEMMKAGMPTPGAAPPMPMAPPPGYMYADDGSGGMMPSGMPAGYSMQPMGPPPMMAPGYPMTGPPPMMAPPPMAAPPPVVGPGPSPWSGVPGIEFSSSFSPAGELFGLGALASGYGMQGLGDGSYLVTNPHGDQFHVSGEQAHRRGVEIADPRTGAVFYTKRTSHRHGMGDFDPDTGLWTSSLRDVQNGRWLNPGHPGYEALLAIKQRDPAFGGTGPTYAPRGSGASAAPGGTGPTYAPRGSGASAAPSSTFEDVTGGVKSIFDFLTPAAKTAAEMYAAQRGGAPAPAPRAQAGGTSAGTYVLGALGIAAAIAIGMKLSKK